MIEVQGRIRFPKSAQEVFDFVADFRNLTEWDPGIAEVRTAAPEPELGSRYEVVAAFAGRRIPMTYEVTEWSPEIKRAILKGRASGLLAADRIEVSEAPGGSELLWTATFEFSGLMKHSAPLMRPLLSRMGKKAMNGLARRLHGQLV